MLYSGSKAKWCGRELSHNMADKGVIAKMPLTSTVDSTKEPAEAPPPVPSYFEQRMAEIRSTRPPIGTKRGYIYFATTADMKQVKIGFADDIAARLGTLQTGNHQEMHMQEAFASYIEAETLVHQAFAGSRIRGEWFKMAPAIEELWGDIFDYQGRHACAPDGTCVEELTDVFIELEAVEELLGRFKSLAVPVVRPSRSAMNE
jgi:hypothetical protein